MTQADTRYWPGYPVLILCNTPQSIELNKSLKSSLVYTISSYIIKTDILSKIIAERLQYTWKKLHWKKTKYLLSCFLMIQQRRIRFKFFFKVRKIHYKRKQMHSVKWFFCAHFLSRILNPIKKALLLGSKLYEFIKNTIKFRMI